MESITSVACNKSLKGLTPVLKTWTELVERYSNLVAGDACYWYNERTTLSVLAAAAWQTKGWVALEEYSTRKWRGYDPGDEDSDSHGAGRCDLYMGSRHGRAKYACEAKQAWQPIGNPKINDELNVVVDKRNKAWSDASKLAKFEASHRLALTICVPMVAIYQTKHPLDAKEVTVRLKDWVDKLHQIKNVDGIAYVFPGCNRSLTNEKGRRVFPGVALLVRERHRRFRTSAIAAS